MRFMLNKRKKFHVEMETGKQKIIEIYENPENPSCFSSIDRVYQQCKKEGLTGITRSLVKETLHSIPTHTRHYSRKWKIPRRRVIAFEQDAIWTMDLTFFEQLAWWNSGYRYCLTIVDILTSFNWVEPIKQKNTEMVRDAFLKILE